MRLSDFILSEMPAILAEWDAFALTLKPAASAMNFDDLRNHAELMLLSIAKDLQSDQTPAEQIIKSRGEEIRGDQIVTGEDHGLARLDSRFTMVQLAAEFRALRASVLKLWGQKISFSSPHIDDIIRFNEAIDQLLAASISSFVAATEKLQEDELKRREQFLAMLAHELRNPLAPISASATLLKVAPNDTRVIDKASSVIARQIVHITALVDDLLEVSRFHNGSIALKQEILDFRLVVDSALEQAHPKMTAKNHHLQATQLEKPFLMYGDSKRLVQVLVNLLVNAAKYTPEGGHIKLDVEAKGEYAVVSITDDGIGIEPEFIPHVFELFSQANPSMDRTAGGLGLGLALVKSLVEQHLGKVTCFSEGVGKGSRFSVALPIYSGELVYGNNKGDYTPSPAVMRLLKFLVVDDNVDAAETLKLILELLGHEVVMTHDSATALSMCESTSPDVILLDIGLPIMDGNELARRIKKIPSLSNSILVAVTGYSQPRYRAESERAGFHYFLTKPIDFEKLQIILDSV